MRDQGVSRRKFLQMAALAGAGATLGACKTVTIEVQKEVEKVVTKVVAETVIVEGEAQIVEKAVEKQVTSTPIPAEVTRQGRALAADAAPYDKQIWLEGQGENKHLDVARDIYSANSVLNKAVEPILRRNENQEIVPAVCEAWLSGPNASYWDFIIRKDCKWSDGTPLTADDLIFTFQHICDPNIDTPWAYFWYPIKGVQDRQANKISAAEVGVEKIDDRTVRIWGQGGGAPQLPALLAYQASVPVPKHKAEADPSHWADSGDGYVGNGPWRLIEWTHNMRMWYEQNEYYNGPHKPVWKEIEGRIGLSDTWTPFLNQELPMGPVDAATLKIIKNDPKLNPMLHFFNNFQTGFAIMNAQRAPFDNMKLRQALAHAVDRETLCFTVLAGMSSPAYTMLPPGFPAFNQAALKKHQEFNVELAKQLMVEAGYPEGKDAAGNQLEIKIQLNGRNPKYEYVQQQWQDNLGIKVTLEVLDGGVWGKRRAEHDLDIFPSEYEYDYIDPANMLTQGFRSTSEKGSNRVPWLNAEFDALCDSANTEADAEKRLDIFRKAEEILVSEAPVVFLTHGIIFQIWWPWLTGVPTDNTGNVCWRYLDITLMQAYFRNDLPDSYKIPTR